MKYFFLELSDLSACPKMENDYVEIHPLQMFMNTINEKRDSETVDDMFKDYIKTWNVPKLSKDDNIVFSKLFDKTKITFDTFSGFKDIFQFSHVILSTFLSFFHKDLKQIEFCAPIILSNCFGFYINDGDMLFVDVAIQSLEFLLKTKYCFSAEYLLLLIIEKLLITKEKSIPIDELVTSLTSIHQYDVFGFNVLVNMYEHVINNGNNKQDLLLLNVIKDALTIFSEKQVKYPIQPLGRLLQNRLALFEPVVIQCLAIISENGDDQNFNEVVFVVSKEYISLFTEDILLDTDPPKTIPFSTFTDVVTIDDVYIDENNIDEALVENQHVLSNDSLKIEDFFSSGVIEKLSLIALLIGKAHSTYCSLFFELIIGQSGNLPKNCFLISIVYLLQRTPNLQSLPRKLVDDLLSSFIFNPNITCFMPSHLYSLYSSLRQNIIEIIGSVAPNYLSTIFHSFLPFPYLFAEIALRMQNIIGRGVILEENVIKDFMIVETNLRFIRSKTNEEYVKLTHNARSSIFSFLFTLLQSPSASLSVFGSQSFAINFLTAFLEPSFNKLVFSKLRNLLLNETQCKEAAEFVTNTIKLVHTSTLKDKLSTLVHGLLSSVTASIPMNHILTIHCEALFRNAIDYIEAIDSNEFFSEILTLALQLFLHNESFDIDNIAIVRLSSLIRQIEGTNLSESTQSKLLCFLAASQSVNISFLSLIRKPSILPLVISVYTGAGMFSVLFSLLNELCKFSCYNCVMMHDGEIDLLLLDMIINFPNQFKFRGCLIDNFDSPKECISLISPVISRILSYKSSTLVAARVLRIICAKPNKIHPEVNSLFLSSLFPVFKQIQTMPSICMPIALPFVYYENTSISLNDLFKESTITFWIKIDKVLASQMNIKCTVFKGMISNRVVFEIFIRQLTIYCEIQQGDKISSVHLVEEVPDANWNCVAVVFRQINPLQIKITSRLNKSNPQSSPFRKEEITPEPMRCFIGNTNNYSNFNEEKLICVYQIMSFYLFDGIISAEDSEQLYILGPTAPSLNMKTMFSSNSTAKQIHPMNSTKALSDISREFKSILGIFNNDISPFLFIPTFASLSNAHTNYGRMAVDFLQYCFGKKMFDVLEVIPRFLISSSKDILTFQLYSQFFNLIEHCTNEKEVDVLLKSVLLNGDLWTRAQPKVLQRIVSHWSTAIAESFHKFSLSFYNYIFSLLRIHFYFHNSESNFVSEMNRDSSFDLLTLRNIMDRFIVECARKDITEEAISCYINHAIFCRDQDQSKAMIRLIPVLFSILKPTTNQISMLHLFNLNGKGQVLQLLLQSITNTYPEEAYNHSILFGYHIPSDFSHENLDYQDVLSFVHSFPIVLMVYLKADSSFQNELISKIENLVEIEENKKMITGNPHWYIWFLLFILQVDPNFHIKFLKCFIALIIYQFDSSIIDEIFFILDILSVQTLLPTIKIKAIITYDLCQVLCNKREFLPHLIGCCFDTLFIRLINGSHIDSLVALSENSPYKDDWSTLLSPKKMDVIFSFNKIKGLLKTGKSQFAYRLRLADWDNMPPSQQMLVPILNTLLSNTPIYTPILHVILLISRYPRAGPKKKQMILNVVTEREFVLLQKFFDERLEQLIDNLNKSVQFFDSIDQKMVSIMGLYPSLTDPISIIITEIENNIRRTQIIYEGIVKNYMGVGSIWNECFHQWSLSRSSKVNHNFVSFQIKRKNDLDLMKKPIVFEKPVGVNVFPCELIRIGKEIPCDLVIEKTHFILYKPYSRKELSYINISHILPRNRKLQQTAIEVFMKNGYTFLIDFKTMKYSQIITYFKDNKIPIQLSPDSYSSIINDTGIVKKWQNNEIGNFMLLLYLNIYSGRSFNDLQNYPVFPWIITEFPEKQKSFRNLSLPIAVQTPKKLDKFSKLLVSLGKQESEHFLFGSSFSAPLFVTTYLVRIKPFASIYKKYHHNNFVRDDVLFSSIDHFFEYLEHCDECRECIPEMYSFPEVFLQNDSSIGDLKVPSWSTDTYEYIYFLRKTLESSNVTKSINNWIDMIWGSSQRGEEAEMKLSLFMPYLFQDVWDRFKQEANEKKQMIQDLAINLGSIPPQLFFNPFPSQNISNDPHSQLEMYRAISFSNSEIHRATVQFINSKKWTIFFQTKKNTFHRCSIDILSKNVYDNEEIIIEKFVSSDIFFISDQKSTAVFYSRKYSSIIQNDSIQKYCLESFSFDFVLHGQDTILTASKEGNIQLWKKYDFTNPCIKIETSYDRIASISYSDSFNIVIFTTCDGSLFIYSLANGRVINKYDLDSHILSSVIFASGFGLILCYIPGQVFIFTSNGYLVKKVPFNREIVKWCTWADKSGTDFICSSDSQGNLSTFEAFYPNKILFSASCGSNIAFLEYYKPLNGIIAITKKSSMRFYPFF